jgi:hypothetical protein
MNFPYRYDECALLRQKSRRVHPTLPINVGCKTAPIILAVDSIWHKYYWRYVAHTASPFIPEPAVLMETKIW